MVTKITNQNQIARHKLAEKINELVDAVNVLQAQVAILEEHAHPTAKVFVSPRKNSQNRRNTRFITAFGKTLCISEWARELNISPYTIYHWANKGADYAKLKLENRFLIDVNERL